MVQNLYILHFRMIPAEHQKHDYKSLWEVMIRFMVSYVLYINQMGVWYEHYIKFKLLLLYYILYINEEIKGNRNDRIN